jgi:sulfur carrier protein ThiS
MNTSTHGRAEGEINMPTVQVPAQLTVEHLMAAVMQLSPAELREFTQQFVTWQEQHRQPEPEEAMLLASVEENSRLPPPEQQRYERLRRKCERETLSDRELATYQDLLQQLEVRNAKRIAALMALAQRRGTTLRDLMAQLGLQHEYNAG